MNKYKAVKVQGVKYDEHRYLMEKHLNRKLDYNEIVHHLNDDKSDNRLENLQVVTRSEHARLHHEGRMCSDQTKECLSLKMKNKPKQTLRKLSNDDVEYIRNNYIPRDKEFGTRALGRRFNISHSHISELINNKEYINPS